MASCASLYLSKMSVHRSKFCLPENPIMPRLKHSHHRKWCKLLCVGVCAPHMHGKHLANDLLRHELCMSMICRCTLYLDAGVWCKDVQISHFSGTFKRPYVCWCRTMPEHFWFSVAHVEHISCYRTEAGTSDILIFLQGSDSESDNAPQ